MPETPFSSVDPPRPPARPGLRDLLDTRPTGGLIAGWSGGLTAGRVLTGLVVASLIVVGGVILWPRPAAPDPELVLPRASTTLSLPDAGGGASGGGDRAGVPTTATVAELVVDVAGEVRQPGVRRVPPGARIADAIEAAGGLTDRADRARINLAAPVSDGERIFVPAVGQQVPPVAVGVAGGGGAATGTGIGTGPGTTVLAGPVNINTASLAELDTLPGVGPTTAQAIIDHREQQGPFQTVDELLDVRGIGDAKLDELRERVVV